jgi:serine/threonine protein kinase
MLAPAPAPLILPAHACVDAADIKKMGWTLGKELGSGHFAKVKLVTRDSDGTTAALKIIKKPKGAPPQQQRTWPPAVICASLMKTQQRREPLALCCSGPPEPARARTRVPVCSAELKKRALVAMEHKILTEVDHPYVVKCYDAYETDDHLYLFLELMSGGELFDRIVDMGHFTEKMAQDVSFKLLGALKCAPQSLEHARRSHASTRTRARHSSRCACPRRYMHDKGIAHRDLKPENMLMTSKDKDAEVKITDFGLSKIFDEQSSLMKTPCGTPGYIAPEVLHMRGYNHQCDVWSFGVIVYILLCGFPPFYADNDAQLFEKIKKGQYEFLKPYWDPISDGAKAFVRRMLIVDPKERATVDQLLADPWLKDQASEKALSTPEELKKSMPAFRKLKGAFLAAWAMERMTVGDDKA